MMVRLRYSKGSINSRRGGEIATKKPAKIKEHSKPWATKTQVSDGWIACRGQGYKAAECPAEVFKRLATPGPQRQEVVKLLKEQKLDEWTRWYIICDLKVKLYGSKEEAEMSLKEMR